MGTLQNLAVGVALLLLGWYAVGSWLNRRRASQLIAVIREAAGAVGSKPTIKWYGRSAFQIEIGEPRPPFAGFYVLCLLEPRDFPLAQAWTRLRGRRDQVLIRADIKRPPRKASRPDPRDHHIAGLTGVEIRPEQPHLQFTLQVGAGDELSVWQCFELAQQYAV